MVTRDLLFVTRDKTSGDRPPRHADACHPSAKGNLERDGNLVCSCRGAPGAGISRRFYGKNPQILLDNARVRDYSMFAFRVNKERKKHRILHILTDL